MNAQTKHTHRSTLWACLATLLLGLFTPTQALGAYPTQVCWEALRSEQFDEAIRCIQRLQTRQKSPRFLRLLARFHQKAGSALLEKNPITSCQHTDRAIELYRRYLQQGKPKDAERTWLTRHIPRLQKQAGYSTLTLTSEPPDARLTLQGKRLNKPWTRKARAPGRIQHLCPGRVQIVFSAPGFKSQRKSMQLAPRSTHKQSASLQPILQVSPLGWTTFAGIIAVGAGAGVVSAFTELKRQELESKLDTDLTWRESLDTAQLLSYTRVGLFIGLGVLAAAGVTIFFLENRALFAKRPPAPPKSTKPRPTTPKSTRLLLLRALP